MPYNSLGRGVQVTEQEEWDEGPGRGRGRATTTSSLTVRTEGRNFVVDYCQIVDYEDLEQLMEPTSYRDMDQDCDHSETSSQSEDCRLGEDGVCRNGGHGLQALFHEECRACMRKIGLHQGSKYPEIRQRMLKKLCKKNEMTEDPYIQKEVSRSTVQWKTVNITAGRKETVSYRQGKHWDEEPNIDKLVQMIEGGATNICTDPKKAAKKARQKEKKQQQKQEEERQREEEERKRKEEEKRALREQQEKEEEERRQAEEAKRLARRMKKKNKKRKDAEEKAKKDHDEEEDDEEEEVLVDNTASPAEAIKEVLTAQPPREGSEKPRMVTIRRHGMAFDNQNIVTITLNDEASGGKPPPVYMLVNGKLVPATHGLDQGSTEMKQQSDKGVPQQQSKGNELSDSKKKKKKNKKPLNEEVQATCTATAPIMSYQPAATVVPAAPPRAASPLDLEKLNLPPGITITKVPNTAVKSEVFKEIQPVDIVTDTDDLDFIRQRESEEFELVSRRRNRTGKPCKERDGSDDTENRASPKQANNNTSNSNRRHHFVSDNHGQGNVSVKTKTRGSAAAGKKPSTATHHQQQQVNNKAKSSIAPSVANANLHNGVQTMPRHQPKKNEVPILKTEIKQPQIQIEVRQQDFSSGPVKQAMAVEHQPEVNSYWSPWKASSLDACLLANANSTQQQQKKQQQQHVSSFFGYSSHEVPKAYEFHEDIKKAGPIGSRPQKQSEPMLQKRSVPEYNPDSFLLNQPMQQNSPQKDNVWNAFSTPQFSVFPQQSYFQRPSSSMGSGESGAPQQQMQHSNITVSPKVAVVPSGINPSPYDYFDLGAGYPAATGPAFPSNPATDGFGFGWGQGAHQHSQSNFPEFPAWQQMSGNFSRFTGGGAV